MPQGINIPEQASAKHRLALGANSYVIVFRFNSKDKAWYFDLYSDSNALIKGGVKVMPDQSLLLRYLLDEFDGDIVCQRVNNTVEELGRNNLGIGKDYELVYFSQEEIDGG